MLDEIFVKKKSNSDLELDTKDMRSQLNKELSQRTNEELSQKTNDE